MIPHTRFFPLYIYIGGWFQVIHSLRNHRMEIAELPFGGIYMGLTVLVAGAVILAVAFKIKPPLRKHAATCGWLLLLSATMAALPAPTLYLLQEPERMENITSTMTAVVFMAAALYVGFYWPRKIVPK